MTELELELYEKGLCLQRLIDRIRQAVNNEGLVLNPGFQRSLEEAIYIQKKYFKAIDILRHNEQSLNPH